jgi:hypothetical protein
VNASRLQESDEEDILSHEPARRSANILALALVLALAACGGGASGTPDAVVGDTADPGPALDAPGDTGTDDPGAADAGDDARDAGTEDTGADLPADADAEPDTPPPPEPACNGTPDLCARPYDFTVFVTTHNAMSNDEDGWIAPNQAWNMRRQLDRGVRAMMIDLHLWDNDETEPASPWLCHGECLFGNRRLSEALVELRDWLTANPREIVTLILENYVPGDEVIATFEDAGLGPLLHAQAPGDPWPTLGRMIEDDRRLVVLTDSLRGGDAPWFLHLWTFAWETHWDNQVPADLDCAPNRGDQENDLFILNHFLTDPLATQELAEQVNHDPFLSNRVRQCREAHGRQVNFLTVDFCEIGDVFDVASTLNAQPWHARDDELRLNQLQVRGTHNSYHVAPDPLPEKIPDWAYTHAPLDAQLQRQAVRQVELDLHVGPDGGFEVYHVPIVDDGTTCRSFDACLGLLKSWSDAHPWHAPLFVMVEPKDELDPESLEGRYDDIDAAIRAVWPEHRLLTPDDVRGTHATLREALETDGWPTLGAVRGQAMFVMLDSGNHRANYLAGHPNLEGRVIWARGGLGEPWGAVLEYGNPERDEAKILAGVQAGYLVRTAVGGPAEDAETAARRMEIALRIGAHIISTDYPVDPGGAYAVALPDGAPANCNPVTTAGFDPPCRSGDLE